MKKKILSFLTAFAMVFGILVAPFTTAKADGEVTGKQETTSVTLHKILQPKKIFDAWPKDGATTGLDKKEYVGEDITNKTIEKDAQGKDKESTSTIESFFGEGSKEIPGVYFAWQKQVYKTNDQGVLVDENDKIIQTGVKKFEDLTKENQAKATKVWKYIKADGSVATAQDPKDANFKTEVLGGITGDTGYTFDTSKLETGDYQIQEIPELSTYQGENKETLTGTKAVPVIIHLPLANADGAITAAHVYPKNNEEKPTTNKDFSDQFNNTQENGRDAGTEEPSQVESPTDKTKDQKSYSVGDKVPYTVKTTIPVNAKYATAYWSDEMTEGLTFDKNLKITLNGKTLVPTVDYTVEDGTNGFKASLTEAGLKKVNKQAVVQTLLLTYTATVNKSTVSQIPESNDVTFHYGNNKSDGNTPIPTKPKNGQLKVTKTWDDGEWAQGEDATFVLVDAQTGKKVTTDDLVAPNGNKDDAGYTSYIAEFKAQQTIGFDKANGGSYTWKYLDDSKEYKAIEINRNVGTNAEYRKGSDGEIVVVNHKDHTQEINPTEPKVKTGEKQFVKRDKNTDKRLDGAEFIVSAQVDGKTKYLVKKTDEQKSAQAQVIQKKRDAIKSAISAYKSATSDTGRESALASLEKAQKELNDEILKDVDYDYTEDKTQATKFESANGGQVKITGLKDGTYKLIETKAPDKYALPANAEWEFKIGEGDTNDDYYDLGEDGKEKTTGDKDATRINNTLVSIPQTGGIGSLIFIVAGLAIMTVAFVAMRKRNAVNA